MNHGVFHEAGGTEFLPSEVQTSHVAGEDLVSWRRLSKRNQLVGLPSVL